MSDLPELIDAFVSAKAVYDATPESDWEGPEWEAYEAAEHAVIVYPCRTLEDVRLKASFFLENEGPYDTIRNCHNSTEETLLSFLRSLTEEAQQ